MTQVTPPGAHATGKTYPLRDYRLLLIGFVVSAAGDWLYKLALPLLVLKLTGSALQTAIIYTLEYVPYLTFAPIGGVVSDRYDRRKLIIGADVVAGAIAGSLAVLAWFHQYRLWLIYLFAFALSTVTPLYQATFLGLVPSTVPRERLSWANSRMQGCGSLLDVAGPLVGASTVVVLGVTWALSLDAISFVLCGVAVIWIRGASSERPRPAHASIVGDLKEAMRFVHSRPALMWGSVVGAGSSLGIIMVEANMVAYLVHFRHLPVLAVGVVFAALGAGAVAGALLTPPLLTRIDTGALILGCTFIGGTATALLVVLRETATIAAVWVLVGASTAVFTVTFYTLRHQLTPEHLLGRVVVITRLIGWSAVPIGPIIGGTLLSVTGSFWPVIAMAAAIQIGVATAALFTPLRNAASQRR